MPTEPTLPPDIEATIRRHYPAERWNEIRQTILKQMDPARCKAVHMQLTAALGLALDTYLTSHRDVTPFDVADCLITMLASHVVSQASPAPEQDIILNISKELATRLHWMFDRKRELLKSQG